jgi:DNA-binding GntR family transcriptional regulator
MPPGATIDVAAIASEFGASRYPVGSALKRLAFDGLAVIAPQHGSFVAKIRADHVREAMLVRRAVEAEVAYEAARRQPDGLAEDLARNLRYQASALEAGDLDDFYRLDVAFHAILIDRLGYAHVGEVLDRSRVHLDRVRRLSLPRGSRSRMTFGEHEAIAAAVTEGRADDARMAMLAHMRKVLDEFEAFAASAPELLAEDPI